MMSIAAVTTPAFEMRNVTVTALRDASVVVLEQVNWTVDPGDYWAVAGLLRSGKSDLLALAAGISRPTRSRSARRSASNPASSSCPNR
jgi:ABC-type molybdenum transport system ATPase subunit/photorepair protein PhrA